jgi:uncharacterized membrane protein YphA (DoxX/SURF4 family)
LFLTDMTVLSDLFMKSGRFQPFTFLLSHYIPLAHIGGGFMMAIGLWTRTAILVNIPVLFGAGLLRLFRARDSSRRTKGSSSPRSSSSC